MKDLIREEQLIELLLQRETGVLNDSKERELEELLTIFPEWGDDQTLALTAAAINLTVVRTQDLLPAALQNKIIQQSERFFAGHQTAAAKTTYQPTAANIAATENAGFFEKLFDGSLLKWSGWAVAAACAILAFTFWITRVPPGEIAKTPVVQPTPTAEPGLAQQREQLLATAQDKIQTKLTDFDPKHPRNVQGDVVWSNSQQKGFVTFHGLPVNDKSKETYQLWIFDAAQNAKTPIDAGVFDVESNGDVIVPIRAKLKVQTPKMFAVTAEKPGGVVVSDLGKVMTIAKV